MPSSLRLLCPFPILCGVDASCETRRLNLARYCASSPDSSLSDKSFLMLSNQPLLWSSSPSFPGTSIAITLLPTHYFSLLNGTCKYQFISLHFLGLGVRSLANASRARQFNPLNPPGVGWVPLPQTNMAAVVGRARVWSVVRGCARSCVRGRSFVVVRGRAVLPASRPALPWNERTKERTNNI